MELVLIKFLQNIYNWIAGLKKYHAMHIFVLPPTLFIISAYILAFYDEIGFVHNVELTTYYLETCFIVYCGILILCSILSICIIFILRLLSIYKKYFVKSYIVLNSGFYNIIFLFGLTTNLLTIILFIQPFNFDIGSILYFPFYCIYSLPWFS